MHESSPKDVRTSLKLASLPVSLLFFMTIVVLLPYIIALHDSYFSSFSPFPTLFLTISISTSSLYAYFNSLLILSFLRMFYHTFYLRFEDQLLHEFLGKCDVKYYRRHASRARYMNIVNVSIELALGSFGSIIRS